MQILSNTNFNIMGLRRMATIFSAALLILSIGALIGRGLNFGIDFTGGTLVEVGYETEVPLDDVRAALLDAGFEDAIVQNFGSPTDVLVRLPPRAEGESSAELSTRVFRALSSPVAGDAKVDLRRVEFVGPQVGDELTEDGGLAMIYALIAIFIYVALRFEYRFSMASVAALVHDVVITIGMFALFQVEFDLSVLAAILAVIGYSLNDTIVVFDRIRENFRKMRKGTPEEIINSSLNQTLSRTIMTSVTTMLVLLVLFFMGGEIIHGFAFALIIGVLIGTYSSIYVASTTVLALGISKEDLMPPPKDDNPVDDRP